MKTISEQLYEDKPSWGDGPWQNEPDKVQWQDEATGLPCLIVRAKVTGSWCGYVGVPKTHAFYGAFYDHIGDVEVHGGLTYSNECQGSVCHTVEDGEDDKIWWFGFDCAHYLDLSPAMVATMRGFYKDTGEEYQDRGDLYRDLEYVKGEVTQLAKQLDLKDQGIRAKFSKTTIWYANMGLRLSCAWRQSRPQHRLAMYRMRWWVFKMHATAEIEHRKKLTQKLWAVFLPVRNHLGWKMFFAPDVTATMVKTFVRIWTARRTIAK